MTTESKLGLSSIRVSFYCQVQILLKPINKHHEKQQSSCTSHSNPQRAFQSVLCSGALQLLGN